MKRVLRTCLAAAAIMAGPTACVNHESTPGDSGLPGAIAFGVSPASRAIIDDATQIDAFHVWAYLDGMTEFKKVLVSEKNGLWVYEPLKQWEEGHYVFGAFYPTTLGTDRVGVQMMTQKEGEMKGGIALNYFKCTDGKDDLLVASHERNYNGTNGEAVTLEFKHLLSKVSIEAKAAGTKQDVTIQSATFSGMAMVGTYKYDDAGGGVYLPDGTWNAWREHESAVIGTFTATDITLPVSGTAEPLFSDLLLIPQEVTADFKVELKCTVDGEDKTLTATLPTLPAWEEGKAYRYTLTITAKEDLKLIVKVLDWVDEEDASVSW